MGDDAGIDGAEVEFGLDENLELILDIHEFLRPRTGLCLESFEPLGAAWEGDFGPSVLA